MELNLKTISGSVASLAIIFTAFVSVETRYAKASDLERLLRGSEQKTIWDLEENIQTSESISDKRLWFERLREKVDEFCDEYPDEEECDPEYLRSIAESIEDAE